MTVDVLVVKMSSMGDVVHAQPLATDIRRHVPGARIDWVCEAAFAAIPALNPAVAEVIPIAWRRWRRSLADPATRAALATFRDRLQARRYDWVLDCQGLLKSAAVARFARAARRAGPGWSSAREPLASLAYDCKVDVPEGHAVARNRMIGAGAFGYPIDMPAVFGLQVPASTPVWLGADPRPLAVLVTGASRPEKLWPEPHWQSVGRKLTGLGFRLAWFWGSDAERERARRIAAACGSVHEATTAAAPVQADGIIPPFLSVGDAAALLASSALVVGLDTGFTHMAGALGRPTVGIFCDFDAQRCAVSGDGFCESFGGVGQVPTVAEVEASIDRAMVWRSVGARAATGRGAMA
jgi:heptosyltransferase I